MKFCVISILLSFLAAMLLGCRHTCESLSDLKGRIKELGEKSTQVLIFLSFAIAAVVFLGYGQDSPSNHQISDRIVQSGTLRLWVLAIFPVAVSVLPLKEFRRDNLRWYRSVRWLKFLLLWAAIVYILLGAFSFSRSI